MKTIEYPATADPTGAGNCHSNAANPSLPNASGSLSYYLVAFLTIALPIIGAIGAIAYSIFFGVRAIDIVLLVLLYTWTVCFGIELGYHRLLTHRSLKVAPWLRRMAVISGCMAAQGPPVWWTAIHRRHHIFSDREEDPHSPNLSGLGFASSRKGIWHSHIGWMFEPNRTAAHSIKYAQDLMKDRVMRKIDSFYVLWILLGLAIPTLIGGLASMSLAGALGGFLWGGMFRMLLGQHALWWGIVTLCHKSGYTTFASRDQSRNNWFVAIIFFGDGWHNNHHAFPNSAKVGLQWWEIDMTWWCIQALRTIGLAWDIRIPTPEEIAKKRIQISERSVPSSV
jgi:stearoyl-CoA desaturase (delta-9 desaturase)